MRRLRGGMSDEEIQLRLKREEELKEKRRLEAAAELSTRLWRMASVDDRYRDIDLDRLPPGLPPGYCQAVATVRSLLDRTGLLILRGGNGTGKTAIACGLARDFCKKSKSALYTVAFEMVLDFRPNNSIPVKTVFDKFVEPALLVIDEVSRDKLKWSPFESQTVFAVIDARYRKLKSTILITNETEDDFKAMVGSSIVSRTFDEGGHFPCDWEDLRGRQFAKAS